MKIHKSMGFGMRRLLALSILLTFFWRGKGQSKAAHAVVAQDGSGDFTTVSDAILAAPDYCLERHIILIKTGTYVENVVIEKEKTNIVLVGEGMNKTIISGNRSFGSGYTLWNSSTVWIKGKGILARGITFENTAGPKMYQAVALAVEAEHATFYQCRIIGFQDTLLNDDRCSQFFRECEILGTIDFICGNSKVVFQNCIISARKPLLGQFIVMTAQRREDYHEQTAIVFQNCKITATEHLRRHHANYKYYLGRPWGDFSRVVIMQSFIDRVVDRKGWTVWKGKIIVRPYYAEYSNWGRGAIRSHRVNWSKVITRSEASYFTVRNFIQGHTWIPVGVPYYLDLL